MFIKICNDVGAAWYYANSPLKDGDRITNRHGGFMYFNSAVNTILDVAEKADVFPCDPHPELDFIHERISYESMGEHYEDNRFLLEYDPPEQYHALLEQLDSDEGWKGVGVCLDTTFEKYGGYFPVVLENNAGERIYVHIRYKDWLLWADGTSGENKNSLKLSVPLQGGAKNEKNDNKVHLQ